MCGNYKIATHMIEFTYQTPNFEIKEEDKYQRWIKKIIESEGKQEGDINYIFCDDEYLHKINVEYLKHDTLTDIITFDYTQENILSSDIFISVERIRENAVEFGVRVEDELHRVMSHGILHLCGFKDKTEQDSKTMREKEEEKMNMF